MTYEVAVEHLSDVDDVIRIAGQLGNASGQGRALLNLARLSTGEDKGDRAKRLPAHAIWLLSLLLLTRERELDLIVRLPASPSLQHQLARGGLFFAMANRRVHEDSWEELEDRVRQAWSRDWQPTGGMKQLEIFRDGGQLDGHHSADVAAFLNVHRAPRSTMRTMLVPRGVRPWLRRAAMLRGATAAHGSFEGVLADVTQVVSQLADNVRDHASLPLGAASLVQVAVTWGPVVRISLTVLDTGIGIVTSAAQRLAPPPPRSVTIVDDAVHGRLPTYDRDRARGLDIVRKIVERHEGRLLIATAAGADEPEYSAVLARLEGPAPKVVFLPIRGTLVTATMPVPAPTAGYQPDRRHVAEQPLPVQA